MRSGQARENARAGEAYVVFGAKDLKYEDILDMNDPPEGVLRIHGASAGDQFGQSVASGDMNRTHTQRHMMSRSRIPGGS